MRNRNLPSLPAGFEYRLDLRHHVTPRLLKEQPVHRWFWFPHSFSPQLIDKVIEAFPLPKDGKILDPFMGAGTTVLRATQLGYQAAGVDLSPLSLFVSRVKLTPLAKHDLEQALDFLLAYTPALDWPPLPQRLQKAFTRQELSHLIGMKRRLDELPSALSDFFRLALLRVLQRVSRAVPDGGWFRWVDKEDQSSVIKQWFEDQARLQISEVDQVPQRGNPSLFLGDARTLSGLDAKYHLVITSPPYPNRHDYSRIFHVELLWLGISEDTVKAFRKKSIRSHVEAASPDLPTQDYFSPHTLERVLQKLPENADPRIAPMLAGYFEDMYLVLKALRAHLETDAICALVVGNVRHAGVMVPVDVILQEVASQADYAFETAWVARLRGNSAQQMGKFGREPARESVLFLRKY